MKKNNQQIMDRIYQLETEISILKTIIYLVLLLLILLCLWFFGIVSWEILIEQSTGDLFYDFESAIVNLQSIFEELPKMTILLSLIFFFILIAFIYRLIKKRRRITTKISLIIDHWKKTFF